MTVSGAKPNIPCIFPFRFNGVDYNECTWDHSFLTGHKAWCSTLVNETGHHVGGQGEWGNCGTGCPILPKPSRDLLGKTCFYYYVYNQPDFTLYLYKWMH